MTTQNEVRQQLLELGEKLTGKQITVIKEATDFSKTTIYNYLNGAVVKIDIACRIIEEANKVLKQA